MQTVPHAPQFDALVVVSTSQPLAALPSQLLQPASQVRPQAPAPQVGVEWGPDAQVTPQPPQEVTAERSVSQPLDALQSAKPGAQAPMTHAPAAQTAEACESEQTLPHAPQWDALLSSATSQPLAALPSQLA